MSEKTKDKHIKNQIKIQRFEELKEKMICHGYKENLGTITIKQANIYALLTAGPIALICVIIYISKWKSVLFNFSLTTLPLYLVIFLASIIIHELLHGLTWSLFCKNKFKSISFGIMWDSLTPYCHCEEPLNFKGYITGGLMPLFILGILVFIISLFTGNSLIFLLSLINILSAGGDTTIALLLCKYKNALFIDHPTDCGFVAFTK